MSHDDPPVLFEERPARQGFRVGIVALNAPKALNALSQPMIELLRPQLTAWREDPGLACVVLRGAGEKAFCAGGDIVAMYHAMRAHPGGPNPLAEHFFEIEYRLDYLLHLYPKPIVLWGNGIVMGGGLGLMAGASHRVVTETSRIAMPEVGIGLYPDVGGTWFLNRMPGRVGLYLGLTGSQINASDALFVGLGDYFIQAEHYEALMGALIETAWGEDPEENQGLCSVLLRDFADRSRQALPDSPVRQHLDLINHVVDNHGVAAILQTLQNADQDDKWIRRGTETLRRGSPTSARLVLEQYRRGRYLSLKEAFMQEWILSIQCVRHHDFAEGVRALLIDKDQNPHWQPATLEAVGEDLVEAHFTLPSDYPNNPLADL